MDGFRPIGLGEETSPQRADGQGASRAEPHSTGPRASRAATTAGLLLMVALLALALRGPSLSLSVFGSADESAFVLAAREVVLGHLPYLTFWDHKPPGSTLLIAAAMAILGPSIEAVRALGLVCVVATAWALYGITRRAAQPAPSGPGLGLGQLAPVTAALLYVAFSTRLAGGTATITETLYAPFTATGVLLLLAAPEWRRIGGPAAAFAAAGLAFGFAAWIKYVPLLPAAFTGAVALAALFWLGGEGDRAALGRVLGCGAFFAAGLLLPTAVSAAFYWWAGALAEFWDANFGFMRHYSGFDDHPRGPLFYALRCTTLALLDFWPLAAAAAAAVLLPSCLGRRLLASGWRYPGALLLAWLAGEVLALVAQGKFYMYHFLPLLPPLAVLAALALRAHAEALARPGKAVAAMAVAVAFVAAGPVATHTRALAAVLSRPDVPREIAALIAAEGRPGDDGVFVANYEPVIYFLAGAPLPTRFAFPVSLTGPHSSVIPTDARAELRRVLGERPRFVVLNTSWRDQQAGSWEPGMMAMVEEAVARDYTPRASWTLAEQMGTVRLFVRRDALP